MSLDPATQAISRFVGLFDLIAEEGRLRQDYLKFKAKTAAEAEGHFLPGISPHLIIGGRPDGYDPGLSHRPLSIAPKAVETSPGYHHGPVQVSAIPDLPVEIPSRFQTDPAPATSVAMAPLVADGPSSIVAVTIQTAYLADNDLVLDGLGAEFVSIGDLQAVLDHIDGIADSLKGFEVPSISPDMDWMGVVRGILDQIGTTTAAPQAVPEGGHALVHILRGTDAEGRVVNGEQVKEAPAWTDLLPLYLRPDPKDQDQEATDGSADAGKGSSSDGPSAADGETIVRTGTGAQGDSATIQPGGHDFSRDFPGRDEGDGPAGNQVIAGANTAINEVGVGLQWIDASVIVVQGDVAKVQAISQVNMLVEHDSIDGKPVAQESAGLNIAEILTTSSGSGEDSGDVLPSEWQLFRLEASLYQVNWVKQVTYVTDFDRAEVTFSAQMTFLGLGENEIVNSTILNEYGYRFDVIFVSGDMVDATIVSQKNVLYDSDSVVTGPAGRAMAEGTLPDPSLSDNLLYNKATIATVGVDSFAEMSRTLSDAAADLAAGRDAQMAELSKEALFSGQEVLRALQIEGDLVKFNLFEQENIVGDADQLRLDMQRLRDDFAAEAKVIAGSNALVNLATVRESGIDTTIMAGGKVYDDALIHQAEWFDTEAPAGGVQMAGLAKEAVAAFLNLDQATIDHVPDGIMPTASHDHGANLDVMQGVLA